MSYFLVGFIIAGVYIIIVYPINSGECPKIETTIYPIFYKGMIIIPYNNTKAIHIHHWLVFLFIFIFNLIFQHIQIISGFCIVLVIQGLSYNDRFNFICNNPYSNHI